MDRALRPVGILFALLTCSLPAAGAKIVRPGRRGDEIGMANTLGPATWQRCAPYLVNPDAKSYELCRFLRFEHHAAVTVRGAAARERQAPRWAFPAPGMPLTPTRW